MNAKKCTTWSDRLHLQPFGDDDDAPPAKIEVFGDKVSLQNWDYTISQTRQLIASLETAINVAECHNDSYVPF